MTILLVPLLACCTRLTNFRTSSPSTSCQRLGLCPSTPYRSWRSWSLPALKNRPSVTSTWTWRKLTYLSITN